MQQYYADVDADGDILGFYVSDIHGDSIPETAKPITEEQWREFTGANGGRGHKWTGSAWRAKTQAELDEEAAALPPAPPSEIEQLKAENASLKQEIAQTNNDMVGFQNFIFEKFPDLA